MLEKKFIPLTKDFLKNNNFTDLYLYLYALFIFQVNQYPISYLNRIDIALKDNEIYKYIKDQEDLIKFITKWINVYSDEEIRNLILLNDLSKGFIAKYENTPDCLLELAEKILDIKSNDKVLDLFSGTSNFMVYSYNKNVNCCFYNIDIDEKVLIIDLIRKTVLNANSHFNIEDVFEKNFKGKKFDKIFMQIPFTLEEKRSKEVWNLFPYYLTRLNENGKLLVIIPNIYLSNDEFINERTEVTKNELLEAIIKLPKDLYQLNSCDTSILVFSQKNDSTIIIDTTKICSYEKNIEINSKDDEINSKAETNIFKYSNNSYSSLSDVEIENIIDSYNEAKIKKKDIEYGGLIINKYCEILDKYNLLCGELNQALNLDPSILLGKTSDETIQFTSLGRYIESINVGKNLTKDELKSLLTKNSTNTKYLTTSNIHNGIIDKELPSILDENNIRNCFFAKEGDIVIGKFFDRNNMAIVTNKNNDKILIGCNLFIIRLKENIDPYFIMAILQSDYSFQYWNSVQFQSNFGTISIEKIMNINIPILHDEHIKLIAEKYKESIEKIQNLNIELKKEIINSRKIGNIEADEERSFFI